MLATHLFSKSIKYQITLPYQWLNIIFNGVRCNSSTSDSSSSDSDSDSDSLNTNSTYQSIDYLYAAKVAYKRKQIEKHLTQAAQILTATSGSDKEKILADLLNKVSNLQKDTDKLLESKEQQIQLEKNTKRKYEMQKKEPIESVIQLEENAKRKYEIQKKKPIERVITMKHQTGKESSIIKHLQDQQEKERNIDYKRKYDFSNESSIIQMLKRQGETHTTIDKHKIKQEEIEDTIKIMKNQVKGSRDFNTDRYKMEQEKVKEPSIIEMLKNQTETTRDINDKITKKQETQEEPSIIRTLMSKSKQKEIDDTTAKKQKMKQKPLKQPSIIKMLEIQTKTKSNVDDKISKRRRTPKPSLIRLMLNQQKTEMDIDHKPEVKEKEEEKSIIWMWKKKQQRDDVEVTYERIFDNDFSEIPDVPVLKIWDMCEERELQAISYLSPQNAFQEMIKWTEEGKLWKFPIDNEQGMEKEHNVHFSKHVFLERHLVPWCPSKGPLRHFMELVCVGLSKNPYMTIEEKYDHIMWYKDYFKDKHDLLDKLGLVE